MIFARRSILTSTLGQIAGRVAVTLGRLAIAALIIRAFGKETFGEYALLLGILAVAESLIDFGTVELFVREICRTPADEPRLLRTMSAMKLWQTPIAAALLLGALVALRYPADVVTAGAVGAISLLFLAGVQVFYTAFRASLSMERVAAAESVSVLAMIPLLLIASAARGGLVAVLACHVVSRVIYLAVLAWLARNRFRLSAAGVPRNEIAGRFRSASTIGWTGVMVVLYEAIDLLVLSRVATGAGLAHYSAAQRLIWPLLMAAAAMSSTLYAVAASRWPSDFVGFQRASQRGLDLCALATGWAVAAMAAGPTFFLSLLGREVTPASTLLRLLAVFCFLRAMSVMIGPLVYVVEAQRRGLALVIFAVAAKSVALAVAGIAGGAEAVAWATIASEACLYLAPLVVLLRRASGLRLSWDVAARSAACAAAAAGAAAWLTSSSTLPAAAVAAGLYVLLVILTGALPDGTFRRAFSWRNVEQH